MPQKLKHYSRCIALLSLLLMFYQCQKAEDLQTQVIEPKTGLGIKVVHGDEHFARSNPKIYNRLKQESHSNVLSRDTEYSEDYDFYFNLDNIQIIEKTAYTQYTVVVESENTGDALLNYVLLDYPDGETLQYLVTYPRIAGNIDHANASMQSLNGQSLLARGSGPIDCADGAPELVDVTQQYICTEVKCTGGNHGVGDECNCGTWSNGQYIDCTRAYNDCGWQSVNVWSCTGGTSGGDPDTSGNPGGSGAGDNDPNTDDDVEDENDDPIETVALDNEAVNHQKNCNELKKLTDDPIIKSKLNTLKTYANDPSLENEKGFSLRKNTNGTTYSSPIITANVGEIGYLPLPNLFGVAHVHQIKGGNPMFSAMDNFALNAHNNAFNHSAGNTDETLSVYILVVSTGTYAIKINDLLALQAYANALPTERDKLSEHRNLNDMYNYFFNPITNQTGDFIDYEKIFTQYIDDKGISLYKANADLSSWTRLEYDTNYNNNIKPTNCN